MAVLEARRGKPGTFDAGACNKVPKIFWSPICYHRWFRENGLVVGVFEQYVLIFIKQSSGEITEIGMECNWKSNPIILAWDFVIESFKSGNRFDLVEG
jgi:hypothetical protein